MAKPISDMSDEHPFIFVMKTIRKSNVASTEVVGKEVEHNIPLVRTGGYLARSRTAC